MDTEKGEFNLQAEVRAHFSRGKDDEAKEALIAVQSLDETLAVDHSDPSKNLVND